MYERAALDLERDLATARRALYRALETAERNGMLTTEDMLQDVLVSTATIMEAVLKRKEATATHKS